MRLTCPLPTQDYRIKEVEEIKKEKGVLGFPKKKNSHVDRGMYAAK